MKTQKELDLDELYDLTTRLVRLLDSRTEACGLLTWNLMLADGVNSIHEWIKRVKDAP
jgi:hypothetical protein